MLLTVAGLVGQVFTLVRELFVAAKVGVSPDLDALLIAAVAPMMLASLLASGTGAAIVPSYLAHDREHGRRAADRLLGATLTWTVLIGIVLTVLVIAGGGRRRHHHRARPRRQALARRHRRTCPCSPRCSCSTATGGLLGDVFQIHDRMRAIAIAWMAGPVVSVVVTIALWDRLGLTALAPGDDLAAGRHVVVLVVLALRFRIMPPVAIRARSGRVRAVHPARAAADDQRLGPPTSTCSRTARSRPSSRPARSARCGMPRA